ncbi:unnamed protein product [Adineta steineri]|uniref:G-protein coupled receptors family 1 profile domain-containing protein n=2 Tax=Adineta steineri TaxID=433720 RepID=A0A815ADY8_9BILA|nr:unnamed protein product [Adineta steineri]CAF1543729.1 unnamed protein product [Adineta steineri]
MSSSSISYFINLSHVVTIYFGLTILVAGVVGGLLNLTVFLSLRTFRQNSCAFYLTIMSFANIIHLMTGLTSHIVINGYGIDWGGYSIVYCKARLYLIQLSILMSFTSLCLAIIDQFLATCHNPFYHRWSNIKLARYIIIGFLLFWLLHGIPFALYFNVVMSLININQLTCAITNVTFQKYFNFGFVLVLIGILPLTIMTLFALLAYTNVQTLGYRTIPLVRRELDKQLTNMVLVQTIYSFCILLQYVITTVVLYYISPTDRTNFISVLSVTIHNCYFAGSFYIYMCVSKRFRQQFKHVLYHNHFCKQIRRKIINNQTLPQISDT